MKLTEREVANILAALRYWQDNTSEELDCLERFDMADHFDHECPPFDDADIDLLCEKIAQISGGTPSAESDCSVIEMGLCEVEHVMLRPNQLYRFIVMPGCDKCKALDVYSPNNGMTGGCS
jgi:hypothetical protein